MDYSITFSANVSPVSSGVGIGLGACRDASGTSYVVATSANLITAGNQLEGIFLTNTPAGQSASVQSGGSLNRAITNLGAGAAGPIGLNSAGVIVRGGSPVIGTCNQYGDAFLQPPSAASGGGGGGGITTANFVQPAVSAQISVPVGDSSVYAINQAINIVGGGHYQIASLPDALHIACTNMPVVGNAAPGSTVLKGSLISPTITASAVPTLAFDPRSFGCLWDNVHDDTPGWNAMMSAISAYNVNVAAYIKLPVGYGYFASDVHVTRGVHIEGSGGGINSISGSGFRFPPLRGMVFDCQGTSGDGGTSEYSSMENFDIKSKTCILGTPSFGTLYGMMTQGVDIRPQNAFVEKGTCVVKASSIGSATPTVYGSGPNVFFRATVGGITANTAEPAGFAATALNTAPFTDGTVTWAIESFPKNFVGGATYAVGQRVLVPGDNRFMYECTTTGVAGGSLPAEWGQPQFLVLVTSGGAVFKTVPVSVIVCYATSLKFRHGIIFGGQGFGIHFESSFLDAANTIYTFTDNCCVSDVQIFYAGGGVHYHGQDANGGRTDGVVFFGQDTPQRTDSTHNSVTGEYCIWDRGQGGNRHLNYYTQFTLSPGVAADVAAGSPGPGQLSTGAPAGVIFFGGNSETAADWVPYPAIFIGNPTHVPQGGPMLISSVGCQGVKHITNTGTLATVSPIADINASAHALYAININSGGNSVAWWQGSINGLATGTGWLTRGTGPYAPRAIYGESYEVARNTAGGSGPGIGLFRFHEGFLGGQDLTAAPFNGYGAPNDATPMLVHSTLRYGKRLVGDTFTIPNATSAVGSPQRVVCTTQGFRALRWSAGQHSTELGSPQFTEATQAEPTTQPLIYSDGTGFVWRLTSGSGLDSVEPTWAGGVGATVTSEGNTWTNVGATAVFKPHDYVSDRGGTLTTTNNTAAQVALSMPLTDTSTNYFRVLVQAYEAASGDGASFELRGCWAKKSTAYIVLKAPAVTESNVNSIGTAWAAVIARNGTNIEVQVTGDTSKTIVWKVIRLDQERYV